MLKRVVNNESTLIEDITGYWTNRASSYSETNLSELETNKRHIWCDLILNHAPKQDKLKILDVGTGPGFFAITLALAGHEVTAVDATQAMLDQATINAKNYEVTIDFISSDVQLLPFEDNSFDLVVTRNVTWDLDQPKQAYQEWHRVLKKSGRLQVYDANWYLFLFDETLYQKYLQDRNNTVQKGLEDHYANTDTQEMERIARQLPLSKEVRPQWDVNTLFEVGFNKLILDRDISRIVWDETELVNYASNPMFMIVAEK